VNEVSVRVATLADAHLLSLVATTTFPLACPPSTTAEDIAKFCETELSPEAFTRYLKTDFYRLWLAYVDGEAQGYVMAVAGDPENPEIAQVVAMRPTVEVSKIYVHETHHGGPAAHALLDAVVEWARVSGAASLWLGVNQLNERANRFYLRNGFAQVGARSFLVGTRWEADFVREKVFGSRSASEPG
jgi:GNAT superfamily N-acetyltransferase